jgi:hypothetical protein
MRPATEALTRACWPPASNIVVPLAKLARRLLIDEVRDLDPILFLCVHAIKIIRR